MKKPIATNTNAPKLFSRKELATRWNCSIETLKRREKSGILNPTVLGRLVRYKLEEIEAIESAGSRKEVR
jgi:glutamine synthetase